MSFAWSDLTFDLSMNTVDGTCVLQSTKISLTNIMDIILWANYIILLLQKKKKKDSYRIGLEPPSFKILNEKSDTLLRSCFTDFKSTNQSSVGLTVQN